MIHLRNKRCGQAFTILELLVVIAIIAILASLLLPVLGQAKRKAQSISCVNKVRQWGLAVRMYTDDNQNKFPFDGTPRSPINAGPNKKAWYNTVASYIGSDSLTNLYATKRHPIPGKGSMFTCPRPTNLVLRVLP
ncbi:MAG: type II secretion system protein, partial [Limisphaerales bacterium]